MRGMHKSMIVFVFLLVFLLTPSVFGADRVISNSQDWRDVYSTSLYANLQDEQSSFLVSSRHATLLLYSLGSDQEVEIVASEGQPWVLGYDDIIVNRKGGTATELRLENVNLELAERLEDIDKFIVVDDAFGYNALSVASYAVVGRYFVLFANDRSINEVEDFLLDRNPSEVIVYGQVDRVVLDALEQFNPEVINLGDRFDNNIEIVKRYLLIKPSKQVVLSNGEFIEQSIVDGNDPVLFIGRSSVPDQVRDYLATSEIDIGVLIGNELVGAATAIRRQAGISVFVKFAQGARNPSGPIAQVEDLDRFALPRLDLGIEIFSLQYNRATEKLEVTLRNTKEQGVWFKNTITVEADDTTTFGDEDSFYIEGNDYKTVVYDADLTGVDSAVATVFTIFGESAKSLEFNTQKVLEIDMITVIDEAEIEIADLKYNTRSNEFKVKIKNIGDVAAFVNVELIDVWINGEFENLGSEEIIELGAGDSTWVVVSGDLIEEDIERNPNIRVRAYYGERSTVLTKVTEAEFEFVISKDDYVIYALVLVLLILILLILFTRRKKKRKKQEH